MGNNATYGAQAATGAAWSVAAVIVGKFASFGSQLVLGWILSDNDFGLYAIAVSLSTLAAIFKDGQTGRLLIQQGDRYAELAQPIFRLSLMFNVSSALILAIAAPAIANAYHAPSLPPLLWIVAASMCLSTLGTVQRSRLSIGVRFRALSLLTAASAIIRQLSTVIFALLEFGPISFVLPLILVAIFEAIAGRWLAGPLPAGVALDRSLFNELMRSSKWLMASALAIALALQGDYLVVGTLQTPAVLGVYFFAYQLVAALLAPLSIAMRTVLLPSFTRIKDSPERQRRAYEKSCRVVSLVGSAAAGLLAVTAQPLIHFLWAGRWDSAGPAVQILALGLPVGSLAAVGHALGESLGRWRWSASLVAAGALVTIGAAVAGSLLGEATEIALCISAGRAAISVIQCTSAARLVHAPVRRFLQELLGPIILGYAAAAATLVLVSTIGLSSMQQLVVSPMVVMALLITGWRLLYWRSVQDCIVLFRRRGAPSGAADRA